MITLFSPAFTATTVSFPPIVIVKLPKSETVMLNTAFSPTVILAKSTTTTELRLDTVKLTVSFTYVEYLSFSARVTTIL